MIPLRKAAALAVVVAVGLALPAVTTTMAETQTTTQFDTRDWDAKIRYDINDAGNVTDYTATNYDKKILCDGDWVVATSSTKDPVNSDAWVRFGIDSTLGEVGYERQANGELVYRVIACDGTFQVEIITASGGSPGHQFWKQVDGVVGTKTSTRHDHHDDAEKLENHDPDHGPIGEAHPWEESVGGGDDNLGDGHRFMDHYYTESWGNHDEDWDPPQVGFYYRIETAKDEAFGDSGDIPFSGQVKGKVTNHDGKRVITIWSNVWLGGVEWESFDEEVIKPDNGWDSVKCQEYGADDTLAESCDDWVEHVQAFGWPGEKDRGDSSKTAPIGYWGSELGQFHS